MAPGLARHLRQAGIEVVEVDRPNRQMRSRHGKSDHVDAVAAARAALSGTATGLPKGRDGNVEAIRVLMVARRSAVDERIQILNQMRHLVFCAPDELRTRFEGLSPKAFINATSTLRPRDGDDVVRYTTLMTLRELGRRARNLHEENKRLNKLLRPLIRDTAPGPARGLRRRVRHRGQAPRRRRRQPRTAALGVRVGAHVRRLADPGVIGQDPAPPPQPRRKPPSQLGALHDHAQPHAPRPTHPRLRRPPISRRQNHGRDQPHAAPLHLPRDLQTPPYEPT